MLDNFLTGKVNSWGNRDVVLQRDDENIMNAACEQGGIFKESGYKKRQLKYLWHKMRKEVLRNLALTRSEGYWLGDGQREALRAVPNEPL